VVRKTLILLCQGYQASPAQRLSASKKANFAPPKICLFAYGDNPISNPLEELTLFKVKTKQISQFEKRTRLDF